MATWERDCGLGGGLGARFCLWEGFLSCCTKDLLTVEPLMKSSVLLSAASPAYFCSVLLSCDLRRSKRLVSVRVLVIVAGEYLIESGINYEGFVLQLLVVLQAGMSAQSAEQILAIVLEGGLLQLLPGAIHSLCRLPEAGGQGLGAATVGQDPLVQGLLLLWLRLCA